MVCAMTRLVAELAARIYEALDLRDEDLRLDLVRDLRSILQSYAELEAEIKREAHERDDADHRRRHGPEL